MMWRMNTVDHKLIRLYVPREEAYAAGEVLPLTEKQTHYLRNVMRKETGNPIRVFNGQDGEWLATLSSLGKKAGSLTLEKQLRPQEPSKDVFVFASPVKKEPFEWMIEKTCELGAAKFVPVLSEHTVVRQINLERLQTIAIEAAEQSERLDVMEITEPVALKNIQEIAGADRHILFCVERLGEGDGIFSALQKIPRQSLGLLMGPEGGWTEDEISNMKKIKAIHPVSLGKQVLRAETAVIAALSCVLNLE